MIIQKDPPTDPILDHPHFRDTLFKKASEFLLFGGAAVFFNRWKRLAVGLRTSQTGGILSCGVYPIHPNPSPNKGDLQVFLRESRAAE